MTNALTIIHQIVNQDYDCNTVARKYRDSSWGFSGIAWFDEQVVGWRGLRGPIGLTGYRSSYVGQLLRIDAT
jgi:hypothetical protein